MDRVFNFSKRVC